MSKELLIKYLERQISRYKETNDKPEDWDPYNTYGDNIDDAYEGGFRDGRYLQGAAVAAVVLEWFKKNELNAN